MITKRRHRKKRVQRYKSPSSSYDPLVASKELPEDLPDTIHVPILEPALVNPYKDYQFWYKGQIHAHSNYDPSWKVWGDDGKQSRRTVMEAYKTKGYKFIALTGHNLLTPPPSDPEVEGIVHIFGTESGRGCRHHMVGVGIGGEDLDRDLLKDTCGCGTIQDRLDYLHSRGIVVVAHPKVNTDHSSWWFHSGFCGNGWSYDDVMTSFGYRGIEVFNRTLDSRYIWDELLCAGRRVWGFGVDDCHNANASNYVSFNRSWIVVNSDKTEANEDVLRQDIIDNIIIGNFYTVLRSPDIEGEEDTGSSGPIDNGPSLHISIHGQEISVHTDQSSVVVFVCGEVGSPGLRWKHYRFAEDSVPAKLTLEGNEDWVRVEIFQFRGKEGLKEDYIAISQPLFPKVIIT